MNLQLIQAMRLWSSRILIVGLMGVAFVSAPAFDEKSWLHLALPCAGYFALGITIIGRMWCAAHLSGNKNTNIVQDGPYSICRNPLYFFTMVGFVGVGLALKSMMLAGGFLAVFLITHIPTILREEKHLREIFGADYDAYKARVPRLIPNPNLYQSAPQITFSAEPFKRAAGDCIMLLAAYPFTQLIAWLHDSNINRLPAWIHLW